MKERWKKVRGDVILIGAIVVSALLLLLFLWIFRRPGSFVKIESDGKTVAVLDLSVDHTKVVSTESGSNTVVIENGQVYVSEADCRDLVCVHRGKISAVGDTIVCLPHRLVVTVTGSKEE